MVGEIYTIEVEGAEYEVYQGTHRIHLRCAHGLHVVAWSDWNKPEEIPPLPACPTCGPKQVVGGCHELHPHKQEPGPHTVYPPPHVDFNQWLQEHHQGSKQQ